MYPGGSRGRPWFAMPVVVWDGPERAFAGWYLNLTESFRRTTVGFDTTAGWDERPSHRGRPETA